MVFNKSGKLMKEGSEFKYGITTISYVRDYCYFGIGFTLSDSFANTQDELRKKGPRDYFYLKRLIDIKSLSVQSIFKLFHSLILPVIGYCCQVWLYSTNLYKFIASDKKRHQKDFIRPSWTYPHKTFKMDILGSHKNLAYWGDSGRVPWSSSFWSNRLSTSNALNY